MKFLQSLNQKHIVTFYYFATLFVFLQQASTFKRLNHLASRITIKSRDQRSSKPVMDDSDDVDLTLKIIKGDDDYFITGPPPIHGLPVKMIKLYAKPVVGRLQRLN